MLTLMFSVLQSKLKWCPKLKIHYAIDYSAILNCVAIFEEPKFKKKKSIKISW